MVETLSINMLKKALQSKLSEARFAASNFKESSNLAPFLQSSKERQFYDQLCFFIDRTKNIRASITDCHHIIKKTRTEITILKRKEESDREFFNSLKCDFIDNVEVIINQLTDGTFFSNLENEVVYKIFRKLKDDGEISNNDIKNLLSNLDYSPISLKNFIPGIYIREGEYEKFSIAKNNLLKIEKILNSKNIENRLVEHDKLVVKINDLERSPHKIAETIFLWRRELSHCLKINYKKEETSHIPSLLIKETY